MCYFHDADKFKSDLMKIAMTTLSSKILSQDKEHFAKLAVDAVLRLKVCSNLVFYNDYIISCKQHIFSCVIVY